MTKTPMRSMAFGIQLIAAAGCSGAVDDTSEIGQAGQELSQLPDVNVSQTASGTPVAGNEEEVDIAVNPKDPFNVVIAGHEATPNRLNLQVFFSRDAGKTWTLRQLGQTLDLLASATIRFDPQVAFGPSGTVYVAYIAGWDSDGDNSIDQRQLVLAASADGGDGWASWIWPVQSDYDRTLLTVGRSTSDPNTEVVHLAYRRGRDLYVSSNLTVGSEISDTNMDTDQTPPIVGPNGELYVVWRSGNTVFLDRSFDDGGSFGTDIQVTTLTQDFGTGSTSGRHIIPAQPERGIRSNLNLAVDTSGRYPGRLYLTFTDAVSAGSADTNIYMTYSDDQGQSWVPRFRIDGDQGANSQFAPTLALDPITGTVTSTWYDARNDPGNQGVEIFGGAFEGFVNLKVADAVSDQSGVGTTTVNDFLEYVGLDSYNCQNYAVWADNSLSTNDNDLVFDRPVLGCSASALETVLYGEEFVRINDRVRVEDTAGDILQITSRGTINIGADAQVDGNLAAEGVIALRDRATVTGLVNSQTDVTFQNQSTVSYGNLAISNVELPTFAYLLDRNLPIPPAVPGSRGTVNGTIDLAPGSYNGINIQGQGTLMLHAGKYYIRSLKLEPGTSLVMDNGDQETLVDIGNEVILRGNLSAPDGTPGLTIYYRGTNSLEVDRPLQGTIVAPFAEVNVRATLTGAVMAKGIQVFENQRVNHVPTFGMPVVD